MASCIISSGMKVCATCAFWSGDRKLNGFLRRVEVQSGNTKGTCQSGGRNRFNTNAMAHCPDYETHPVLMKRK